MPVPLCHIIGPTIYITDFVNKYANDPVAVACNIRLTDCWTTIHRNDWLLKTLGFRSSSNWRRSVSRRPHFLTAFRILTDGVAIGLHTASTSGGLDNRVIRRQEAYLEELTAAYSVGCCWHGVEQTLNVLNVDQISDRGCCLVVDRFSDTPSWPATEHVVIRLIEGALRVGALTVESSHQEDTKIPQTDTDYEATVELALRRFRTASRKRGSICGGHVVGDRAVTSPAVDNCNERNAKILTWRLFNGASTVKCDWRQKVDNSNC